MVFLGIPKFPNEIRIESQLLDYHPKSEGRIKHSGLPSGYD